jgi:hypothetical protein
MKDFDEKKTKLDIGKQIKQRTIKYLEKSPQGEI